MLLNNYLSLQNYFITELYVLCPVNFESGKEHEKDRENDIVKLSCSLYNHNKKDQSFLLEMQLQKISPIINGIRKHPDLKLKACGEFMIRQDLPKEIDLEELTTNVAASILYNQISGSLIGMSALFRSEEIIIMPTIEWNREPAPEPKKATPAKKSAKQSDTRKSQAKKKS